MPGTTHSVVNNKPIDQGPIVVGAVSANREHLCTAPHQQNLFIADMTN